MKFPKHCADASQSLQTIATVVDSMEAHLLELEEDRHNTDLLTHLVQELFMTKSLSEGILHEHLHFIEQEEAGVAEAIKLAHDELMRRAWAVRHDLEILTKVARPRAVQLVG